MFLYSRDRVWQIGEEKLTFGRHARNQVLLNDRYVSQFHAVMKYQGQDLTIRDLNSRNGVYINGKKTEIAVLKDGDKIQIGKQLFWISDNQTDLIESWRDRVKVFLVRKSKVLKCLLAIMPLLIVIEERFFGGLETLFRVVLDLIGLLS